MLINVVKVKLKFQQVPESANLHYGVDKRTGRRYFYPLVRVNNVYVFPGVPRLLESSFKMLEVQVVNYLPLNVGQCGKLTVTFHDFMMYRISSATRIGSSTCESCL